MQVQPKTPIQTFAIRLSDSLEKDTRRILQEYPNSAQWTDYGPDGMTLYQDMFFLYML